MKRFALCLTLALLLTVINAGAQRMVADQVNTTEQMENPVEYPVLDKQFRLAINGGFSYRLGKIIDEIPREFARKMRPGYNFGAEAIYFPNHAWGIGVKYAGRVFNAEMGQVSDKLNLHYFAPMFASRLFDWQNRNAWVMGLSVGYLSFVEKITANYDTTKISKGGLGASYEIGYDIRISKRNFFGLKLSLTSGFVSIDTPEGKQKENASSIDLSAGLRF